MGKNMQIIYINMSILITVIFVGKRAKIMEETELWAKPEEGSPTSDY